MLGLLKRHHPFSIHLLKLLHLHTACCILELTDLRFKSHRLSANRTHHYSATWNSVFKSFSRFQTAHTLPFDLVVLPPPPSRGCIPLLSAVAVRTFAVSFSFVCFYFLHCTTQICFLCLPYDQSKLLTWRMNLSIKFRSTAIFFVFSSV